MRRNTIWISDYVTPRILGRVFISGPHIVEIEGEESERFRKQVMDFLKDFNRIPLVVFKAGDRSYIWPGYSPLTMDIGCVGFWGKIGVNTDWEIGKIRNTNMITNAFCLNAWKKEKKVFCVFKNEEYGPDDPYNYCDTAGWKSWGKRDIEENEDIFEVADGVIKGFTKDSNGEIRRIEISSDGDFTVMDEVVDIEDIEDMKFFDDGSSWHIEDSVEKSVGDIGNVGF